MRDQNIGQLFIAVVGGKVDGLQIVMGGRIDRESGGEHVFNGAVALHPGGFGEEAVVLFAEGFGGATGGGTMPELEEPVIEGRGIWGIVAELGASEANCLAARGVVVDVDDVGAGSVRDEEIEGGGVAPAADRMMEAHFPVTMAGAEIGVGSSLEHFLEAGEIGEVELAENAIAEPGRLEARGGEDGVEDGVGGMLAGVVEDLVVVGIGSGVKQKFGESAQGIGGRVGRLRGKVNEPFGGLGGIGGEDVRKRAEIGGFDGGVNHRRSWSVRGPRVG